MVKSTEETLRIGARLRSIAQYEGHTQRVLAENLKIDSQTVWRWFNGQVDEGYLKTRIIPKMALLWGLQEKYIVSDEVIDNVSIAAAKIGSCTVDFSKSSELCDRHAIIGRLVEKFGRHSNMQLIALDNVSDAMLLSAENHL